MSGLSDDEQGPPAVTAPFSAATEQQAAATSASTGGVASEGYGRDRDPPPGYDGQNPEVTFRLFEKNLRLWQFETDVPQRKQGAKLLRVLTGTARMAVEELEYEQIASDDGLKNIVNRLREYYTPHLEVSLPRAFESAVYGAPRGGKESFSEYVHRMERSFVLLAKEGVTLPPGAIGYIIYRQSSLTEAQEQRVQTWCEGKYEREPIIRALRRLDKVIKEKGTKNSYATEIGGTPSQEHVYVGEQEQETKQSDGEHIFVAEGDLDVIYEEPEMLEALASYQEVRQALKDQRNSRGYFPGKGGFSYGKGGKGKGKFKVHREQLKLRTRCWRCQQIGHISAECTNKPVPKDGNQSVGRSSQSNSSSGGSNKSGFFVSTAEESFVGVVEGGNQVQSTDFWLRQFVEDLRSSDKPEESDSRVSYKERARGLNGEGNFCGIVTSSFEGVVDTAAEGGLIGAEALRRLEDEILKRDLRCCWTPKTSSAKGVGGNAMVCGVVLIPLGIGKINGVLEATVVEGDVPLLLPIKLLKTLQAVVNLPKMQLELGTHGRIVPMREMPSGHCVINITDFSDGRFETPCGMEQSFEIEHEKGAVLAMLAQPRVVQFDCPTHSLRGSSTIFTHGVADEPFASGGSSQAAYAAKSGCGAGVKETGEFPSGFEVMAGVPRQDVHLDAAGGNARCHWRLVPRVVGAGLVALVRSYGGRHICSTDPGSSPIETFAVEEPTNYGGKCLLAPQRTTEGWREPGTVIHRMSGMQLSMGDAIQGQGGSLRSETTEGPLESNEEEPTPPGCPDGSGTWVGTAVGGAECGQACVGDAECEHAGSNLHRADEEAHRREDQGDVQSGHAESSSIFAAGLSADGLDGARDAEDADGGKREGGEARSSTQGHDEEFQSVGPSESRQDVRGKHAINCSGDACQSGVADGSECSPMQMSSSCGAAGGEEGGSKEGPNILEVCPEAMRLLPMGSVGRVESTSVSAHANTSKITKEVSHRVGKLEQRDRSSGELAERGGAGALNGHWWLCEGHKLRRWVRKQQELESRGKGHDCSFTRLRRKKDGSLAQAECP